MRERGNAGSVRWNDKFQGGRVSEEWGMGCLEDKASERARITKAALRVKEEARDDGNEGGGPGGSRTIINVRQAKAEGRGE